MLPKGCIFRGSKLEISSWGRQCAVDCDQGVKGLGHTPTTQRRGVTVITGERGFAMADAVISFDKIKALWRSQIYDEENWAMNSKLLRAVGLFAGSIVLMRNFGDLMAI
ncbi:hypothetical protein R6Q57_002382 [Mikania cordata]